MHGLYEKRNKVLQTLVQITEHLHLFCTEEAYSKKHKLGRQKRAAEA